MKYEIHLVQGLTVVIADQTPVGGTLRISVSGMTGFTIVA